MILSGNRVLPVGDSVTYDIIAPLVGAYRYYLEPHLKTFLRTNHIQWCGNDVAAGYQSSGNKMCGTSGMRVGEILDGYAPRAQAETWKPDLIIIHLGTNDMTKLTSGIWVGGSIESSIASYSSLLTELLTGAPDAIVLACKIIPNNGAADANITLFNAALETMVLAHPLSHRILMPDMNAAFKSDPLWATSLLGDNTHPNNAGKIVMADSLNSFIVANITPPERVAGRKRAITSFPGKLAYAASTATTIGSGVTLPSTSPWAISMDVRLGKSAELTTNQGIFRFKTDQATPFFMLFLKGTSNREIEFGSNSNFGRFFPNTSSEKDVFSRMKNGWHQIVLVYNGVDRTASSSYTLYIDSLKVNVTSGSGFSATTNDNAVGGAVSGGVAGTFDMAYLRIWSGGDVFSADNARDLYFNHKAPTGPTLIRSFNHSELSGSTLIDSTGNQNATIGTASWSSTNTPMVDRTVLSTRVMTESRSMAS